MSLSEQISFEELSAIATQFASPQLSVLEITPLGNGNINDTYLVELTHTADASKPQATAPHPEPNFVLQRINTQVFPQPKLVMQNMQTYSEHVHQRLAQSPLIKRRWETPRVLYSTNQQNYYIDAAGDFWRGISYIAQATTYDTIQSSHHAQEIGFGLGMFHNLVSDLSTEQLADTLEGFHITPNYLRQYETLLAKHTVSHSPSRTTKDRKHNTTELDYCLKFVETRKGWASVLETAKAQGELKLRLMHGDPKINNILFDQHTGKAIGLIDLDTVKPGLIHYDIGDCLRSGCNPLGEETQDWDSIEFDTDICRALLQGYLSIASEFLVQQDYAYLYDAIRLIAFELGLRFLTDYLAGDVYFKTTYAEHNLIRALVQFKLTARIEAQESVIRSLIQDFSSSL